MLAILLTGGGVLAVLGLPRAALANVRGSARRNAFVAIAAVTLVVLVPLAITGRELTRQTVEQQQARLAAERWVAGTPFRIQSVEVTGNRVSYLITGPGEPPPFEALVTDVRTAVGESVAVELEVVSSQRQRSDSALTGIGR